LGIKEYGIDDMRKCCYSVDGSGNKSAETCSGPTAPAPAPAPASTPTPAPPSDALGCCWQYNCADDSNTVHADGLLQAQCPNGPNRSWVPGKCGAQKPPSACPGSSSVPSGAPSGAPPGVPIMEPTYTGPVTSPVPGKKFPPHGPVPAAEHARVQQRASPAV
jgi:hypothetical protein